MTPSYTVLHALIYSAAFFFVTLGCVAAISDSGLMMAA